MLIRNLMRVILKNKKLPFSDLHAWPCDNNENCSVMPKINSKIS
jgi:hypothetical protein